MINFSVNVDLVDIIWWIDFTIKITRSRNVLCLDTLFGHRSTCTTSLTLSSVGLIPSFVFFIYDPITVPQVPRMHNLSCLSFIPTYDILTNILP